MPHTIIIFGASGDLTSRKLVPALYNLCRAGTLPSDTRIVGFSRTPHSDEEWRAASTDTNFQKLDGWLANSIRPCLDQKSAKVQAFFMRLNAVPFAGASGWVMWRELEKSIAFKDHEEIENGVSAFKKKNYISSDMYGEIGASKLELAAAQIEAEVRRRVLGGTSPSSPQTEAWAGRTTRRDPETPCRRRVHPSGTRARTPARIPPRRRRVWRRATACASSWPPR